MDNTLASKTHAWTCKQVHKDANKANRSTNKHGKNIIAQSETGERHARSNLAFGDTSQVVTPKQDLVGIGCNHTTINPLRVSNVAKLRTREASTSMEDKA